MILPVGGSSLLLVMVMVVVVAVSIVRSVSVSGWIFEVLPELLAPVPVGHARFFIVVGFSYK